MKKIILISLAAATVAFAGGYKIPENSLNSVALSGAYVANAHGADAAYSNPANMVFSTHNGSDLEVDLTYIGLSEVSYKGGTLVPGPSYAPTDTKSQGESFVVPTLHYVSPAIGNMRFGLSMVAPTGLAKRWNDVPASLYAKEFSLEAVEVNPTLAYKLNDQLSVAFGVRALYAKAKAVNAQFNLEGTSLDWGYNLAVTLKPAKEATLAVTYRSRIDMGLSGDASGAIPTGVNATKGNTILPLPGQFSAAFAYTFVSNTTVEMVLEHTMWSAYDSLNINFEGTQVPGTNPSITPKKWEDTDTFRLGVTQKYDSWTAMAGLGYDPSPVPSSTINYELPDSTGKFISLGGRYAFDENLEVGLAALYDAKDDRKVNNTVLQNGEFTGSAAYLITAGIEYKF